MSEITVGLAKLLGALVGFAFGFALTAFTRAEDAADRWLVEHDAAPGGAAVSDLTAEQVDAWLAERQQVRVTREMAWERGLGPISARRVHPFPGNQLRRVDFEHDGYDDDREPVVDVTGADVVTSEYLGSLLGPDAHRPVIDIDHRAFMLPSSTPGHGHLYLDVPMTQRDLMRLLRVMAKVGVVEPGYAAISEERGYSAVRLPWVRKGERRWRAA